MTAGFSSIKCTTFFVELLGSTIRSFASVEDWDAKEFPFGIDILDAPLFVLLITFTVINYELIDINWPYRNVILRCQTVRIQ